MRFFYLSVSNNISHAKRKKLFLSIIILAILHNLIHINKLEYGNKQF